MKRPLKIALYYDFGPGGAKRALVGMARGLRQRGHRMTLFVHGDEAESPLSLMEFVDEQVIVPPRDRHLKQVGGWLTSPAPEQLARRFKGDRALFLARRFIRRFTSDRVAFLVKSYLDSKVLSRRLKLLDEACRNIAAEIEGGGFDVAFVHGSSWTQSPMVLTHLETPSIYYAQEPMRSQFERPSRPVRDPYLEHWRKATGVDEWWGHFLRKMRKMREKYDKRNVRNADKILVNSCFSRESFWLCYGIETEVCYLGVDIELFSPAGSDRRENAVLAVGDLVPIKMHGFCVDALACLEDDIRPTLWIVGRERYHGHAKALKERASHKGVKIELLEDASDEVLVEKYRRARATLLAAFREPFGFTAIESMACGTPVVAVAEGGYRETVKNEITGFLVRREPHQFSNAIKKLLLDDSLRRRMGQQGREEVLKNWRWDATIERLEKIFEQVTIQKNSHGGK